MERMLGNPRKAIAVMFIPLLAAMAVGQVNSFVDTFFTSGLASLTLGVGRRHFGL